MYDKEIGKRISSTDVECDKDKFAKGYDAIDWGKKTSEKPTDKPCAACSGTGVRNIGVKVPCSVCNETGRIPI